MRNKKYWRNAKGKSLDTGMNTADMKKKVLDFIREQHMVEEGDGVLAAVSGGADSV